MPDHDHPDVPPVTPPVASPPEPPSAATPSPQPAAMPPVIELAADPFPVDSVPADAVPSASSRTRKIVLRSLLAVAAAGIAVIAVAGWQIGTQKNATLVAPPQVAGMRLDQSEDARSTADYLQTGLAAELGLDRPVGAIYTAGDGRDVLFFGGTSLIWSPGRNLGAAFRLIDDDQGAVTNLHAVPPGHFGGTMRCGTTRTDNGDMPVCGWADHGSLALALFPNRTEADAAALLREIRDSAQSRS